MATTAEAILIHIENCLVDSHSDELSKWVPLCFRLWWVGPLEKLQVLGSEYLFSFFTLNFYVLKTQWNWAIDWMSLPFGDHFYTENVLRGPRNFASIAGCHCTVNFFKRGFLLQLVESGKVAVETAKLLLDKSELARQFVQTYFNLTSTLFFDFTHLVCRTAKDSK